MPIKNWGVGTKVSIIITGLLFASIAFASISVGNSTTNLSNDVIYSEVRLSTPSDVVAGDLLIASISTDGGSAVDITPPSGWTFIASTDNDSLVGIVSYWRVATSSSQTLYTWTINTQIHGVGGITRYIDVDTTDPIDVVASSTGRGTSASAPSATTTNSGDRVIRVFAVQAGKSSTLFATSTGLTKSYDVKNTPLGPTISAQQVAQTSSGSTGTADSSFSTGTRDWAAQTIALRPNRVATLNSYQEIQSTSGASVTFTVPTLTHGGVACMVDSDSNNTVSSGTFGGVSATLLDQGNSNTHPGASFIALGVPSGSQTFSVNSGSGNYNFDCWFLENVDQTTPVNAHNYSGGSSVTATTTASTFILGSNRNGSVTNSSPLSHQSNGSNYWAVDSNGMITSGAFTNTWTGAIEGGYLIAINPY